MYAELGIQPSALAVAHHYAGMLTGFVLDDVDHAMAQEILIPTLVTQTLMKSRDDRRHLAQDVLHLLI
jgi:LPPG:FO 2-phospho-L-lactate transferase